MDQKPIAPAVVDLETIFRNNLIVLYGESIKKISQQQYNEMKILFYAGMGCMYVTLVPETAGMTDEWVVDRANSVEDQLKKYWAFQQEMARRVKESKIVNQDGKNYSV